MPVALFGRDGGSLAFSSITYTDAPILPGTSAAGMELQMLVADLGTDGLTVRADELGAGFGLVEECDETNNAADWNEALR